LHVVFGAGGPGCPSASDVVTLGSEVAQARAGVSVAAGSDVDGDMVPDIAAGGPGYVSAGADVGAAWLVSGAYVLSLPRERLREGMYPVVHPMIDPAASGRRIATGRTRGGSFGFSVALVPSFSGSRAAVAVGVPFGVVGSVRSGGVYLFDFRNGGLDAEPSMAFGGESVRAGGEVGHAIAGGVVGGRPFLAVGGTLASGAGRDLGAVYSLDLGP
jgi:hypothetical protein